MNSALLAAIIGSCTSIIVCLISTYSERKRLHVEQALKEDRIFTRLSAIESKVAQHNEYAKIFHDIKKDIALIHKDIDYIKAHSK